MQASARSKRATRVVSTFTTNLNIELPGHNDFVGTWDTPTNANWSLVDNMAGGTLLLNATGLSGTIALTNTQLQPRTIQISGAPSAAITYSVPSGVGGQWIVRNSTTGGKTVGLVSAAGGSTVTVPASLILPMWCDGTVTGMLIANSAMDSTGVHFPDGTTQASASNSPSLTGVILAWAFTTAPTWALLCNGSAVSRATYSALNTLMSAASYPYGSGNGTTTFNVPDLRGRAPYGNDVMGSGAAGRITSGGSGINGAANGSSGGAQAQSISVSGNVIVSSGAVSVSVGGTVSNNIATVGSEGTLQDVAAAGSGVTASGTTATITANGGNTLTGTTITQNPTLICSWIIGI